MSMRACTILVTLGIVLLGCRKEAEAPLPVSTWDLYESTDAIPISALTPRMSMEGVFRVAKGSDILGPQVALKWTWSAEGNDTAYHVSMFTGLNAGYFIGQGKSLNGSILLNGYWRQVTNTNTGLMRLTIAPEEGASLLLGSAPVVGPDSIIIRGVFGDGQEVPLRPVELHYLRPLFSAKPFERMAHRGGGRTADLLTVSENSVEMIRKASRFGASGVEIDVRFTSDGVPILYHDNELNLRQIQPCGLVGPIEDYSYAQLSGMVRLIHGEKIPTLEEALHTIVHETPLDAVWLDTKYIGDLTKVQELQAQAIAEGQAIGRTVQILIGLPGQGQYDQFIALPNYTSVPSLCELTTDQATAANSGIWGPRWTLGTQDDNVALMHGQGRKVWVWTVDGDSYIDQFVHSNMDGILSNYPSLVAYHHYVR